MADLPVDPNADLLQAMTQAGLAPQQIAALQRRYKLGQSFMQPEMAQGRQVGGTYVAASPWEHLSNAITPMLGASITRSAQDRENELTSQVAGARAKLGAALQDKMGKPGEFMPGGAGDQQGIQQLALAAAGSGDSAMQNLAQTYQHQSVLQNSVRHEQIMEGLEQQKVGQGNYEPIKNLFGETTGSFDKRTGKYLPLSTGGGGGGTSRTPWTQAALDQSAEQYAITGDYKRMPGKPGSMFDTAVKNRAVELYPDASLAENKAAYVANQKSIATMQKSADSIDAFENTALKNARMMLDTAKGLVDTGSPLINKPVRAIMQTFAGDPKVAQFNAARQVAIQEIGKVLGGAVAGGVVTDSQRHDVEGLIRGDATIPQMEATLSTLEADMAGRKAATQAGLQAIRGRMNPKGQQQAGAAPPAAPPPAGPGPSAPSGRPRRTVNGDTREWDGSKWVPANG
jgi:hypothetical protein